MRHKEVVISEIFFNTVYFSLKKTDTYLSPISYFRVLKKIMNMINLKMIILCHNKNSLFSKSIVSVQYTTKGGGIRFLLSNAHGVCC